MALESSLKVLYFGEVEGDLQGSCLVCHCVCDIPC